MTCDIHLDSGSELQVPHCYAGAQYTSFRCLKTEDGVRVFGAFNNGNWYEFAHAKAQTLGGGQPVSVVPYFMGSDCTVARKNMSIYP